MRATGAYAVEKLSVELLPSPGVGLAERALLDGAVEVLWARPMRAHEAPRRGPNSALACFAEVVCRDPFSIVGQYPNPGFRLADLSQMPTAIVSEVPTPWLCLQEDLRQAGIDPAPLRRDGRDDHISLPSARSRRAGRRTRALLGTVGVGREPCFPKAA
jgi:NitT/TauT family transport system substrate-binding protein